MRTCVLTAVADVNIDSTDYFEEAFELVAAITFYGPGISPSMWILYDKMFGSLYNFGDGYLKDMMKAFRNFIARDMPTFLARNGPATVFQYVYQVRQRTKTGVEWTCAPAREEVLTNCGIWRPVDGA